MSRNRNRPLVQNAGSVRQVRRAGRKEGEIRSRLEAATFEVLSTPGGRMFIWELLRMAGVYSSVWADHGQRMAYNAGRQDYGHELLALLVDVDENLYMLMEREARAWQRREETKDAAAESADGEDGDDE